MKSSKKGIQIDTSDWILAIAIISILVLIYLLAQNKNATDKIASLAKGIFDIV